jgi:hypothetical protein
MVFLGLFISFVVLITLTIFTILFYLKLREKNKSKKMFNEVFMIGFVFLVSFSLRFIAVQIEAADTSDTIEKGIARGWYVLYNTIGGLSFEGIDSVNCFLTEHAVMQCFYYGATVYAGITFLLIISVGVSYELYSFVKMLAFWKKYKAVYVFTSFSEESLLLAQNIQKNEGIRVGKNQFAILFLGDELEPFDKKKEAHRCIMENGFFYWSYGRKNSIKNNIKKYV